MSIYIYTTSEGGNMILQNRMRVLRAERKISQQDLADNVGLSRQSVNSIELGKFKPSIVTALKIAAYFGVKVEDVFMLGEGK
jgi:putative transcriptional regulator